MHRFLLSAIFLALIIPTTLPAQTASDVLAAMKKAATFYREDVATHGGYVYFYSVDLKRRFGEGTASEDQIWVQPPGTPTVGMAYVKAYEATQDQFYLDAATAAGEALAYGQLASGGWTNCIDFNPKGDRVAQYKNGKAKGKNNSSLDDDQTQSAIRFLMRLDRAHNFENKIIHEAATSALDALLAAQFPCGAFPQVWTGPNDREVTAKKASFPQYNWQTEGRIKNYWDMPTLNDGVVGTVAQVLIEAEEIYEDQRYRRALVRLGNFLVQAQMPEPQPAWAQQYNLDLQPIWARRFEPPAIAGRESQDAIDTLLTIYQQTGDTKYLKPIPPAVKYLEASLLPDGRMPRYYELETNKPLYMNRNGRDYFLTHDDTNLPDHYGWKSKPKLERLKQRYLQLTRGEKPKSDAVSASEVQAILKHLDSEGRWIDTFQGEALPGDQKFRPGDRYISSQTFADNMANLSTYLLTRPQ